MATAPGDPYEPFSATPSRKGMSGGTKVLLAVLITGGVLAVLCCGGIGLMGVWFARTAEQSMSKDPASVRALTESIADISVPEPLEPKMSMDMKIPVLGSMRMAVYGSENKDETLMLMELTGRMASEPDQAIAQANQQMQRNDKFEAVSSEKVELEVRGKPSSFTFAHGYPNEKAREAKTLYLHVTGAFVGKSGPAFLLFTGPESRWKVEDVKGLIQGIK
ncbi:MAG TPA: hypothetical protein VHZ24_10000 [Pirellulales bacterium]|jgi:hypothetical protein|nr:hypothetical protein [Pirellulales bacterium]